MPVSGDFETVVAGYYGPLYQFAFSLTRDEADSCDLVQQTFCIWARKGHQLREVSKVKTWLFTTLHREFLSTCRKRARFPQVELDHDSGELPVVSPAAFSQHDTARVMAALAQLDDIYQTPVALFYLQDCTYGEIAEIIQVPLGTVKSRLARGVGRLQELFAAKTAPPRPHRTNL